MRIIGRAQDGAIPVADLVLGHGEHPDAALHRLGWVLQQPLEAACADGDITVAFAVREVTADDAPPLPRPVANLEPEAREAPTVRQRIGTYAIVLSPWGLLGTVNAARTGAPGTWSLPGGGLDAGEDPVAGLLREVFEETAQSISESRLLMVQSDHWIGRSPNGILEDFHALRLIYAAACETPSQPTVRDLGGTTERADWVPLATWPNLPWTHAARQALDQLLPTLSS